MLQPRNLKDGISCMRKSDIEGEQRKILQNLFKILWNCVPTDFLDLRTRLSRSNFNDFFLQQTVILILSWCGFIALICNASLKQTFQSVSANFFRSLWLDKQDQLIGRLFDPSVHVPIDANKCCQSSCRWLINTHRILVIGPSPVPARALPGTLDF